MYPLLLSISILLFGVGLVMIFSPKAADWLNKSGNIVVLTEKKSFRASVLFRKYFFVVRYIFHV